MCYFNFGVFFALIFFVGCTPQRDEVRTYTIPKIAVSTKQSAPTRAIETHNIADTSSSSSLQWVAPANWRSKKGSDLRLASFEVVQGAENGDASIVALAGDAGGIVANVNRWREQAGLPPADLETIKKTLRTMQGKLGSYQLFSIQAQNEKTNSILAAIFQHNSQSIFVKLTGKWSFLRKEEGNFLKFCQSLREHE